MNALPRWLGLVSVVACGAAAGQPVARQLKPSDDRPAGAVGQTARASLFGDRRIEPAPAGTLPLDAPGRAIDAAVVRTSIRTRGSPDEAQYAGALYVFVDATPAPIPANFHLTADSGRADIETRVRAGAPWHVRASAQASAAWLYGVTRFVKASGRCSAPAGTDTAAARADPGPLRMCVDGNLDAAHPVLAQWKIDDPHHFGLAMDQATRQDTPAHVARGIGTSRALRPVLSADVDSSISENPLSRVHFLRAGNAEPTVNALDLQGPCFDGSDGPRASA
jgi:sulfur-oxidizing protein SoxY